MAPQIHIVGGFLGSGKTTAIAALAKQRIAAGQRVGVVTNDQGKYLVDTAFFALDDVPTVEVTGGCFCCNYDDFAGRLTELIDTMQPDIIFAESVGSCADVVATVVKPLLLLEEEGLQPTSFSVFADGRLLHRRLKNLPLPFSENLLYIFDQQIAEAGLLEINKIDLLSEVEVFETFTLARKRYPEKTIHLQNAHDAGDIAGWAAQLQPETVTTTALKMDYARYGAGEAELAWLDETMTLRVPNGQARSAGIRLLDNILSALRRKQWPIGHVKFLLQDDRSQVKISFPTVDETGWQQQVPDFAGSQIDILLNARVAAPADALQAMVEKVIADWKRDSAWQLETLQATAFHPRFPQPTHRLATVMEGNSP
jgi:Ni2+-binding GTPase involved in maturation of urease and hydrogenase